MAAMFPAVQLSAVARVKPSFQNLSLSSLLISNLDDISEEMEIIEWVKLKEICKETYEIK